MSAEGFGRAVGSSSMVFRPVGLLLIMVVVAAACSRSVADGADAANGQTTVEDYPDAQSRALAARARERRPVDNSALPPRHLEPERHPESLIDRSLIVSGGPPPDGIPSIDEPRFVAGGSVDWLADEEPVIVLTVGSETRIYPTQILIWHEIVNDEVDGRPITVTYCPLCDSVVAFETTVDGPEGEPVVLDFGTSGALYQSALVMYDRQTESLWTHFDGRAVIGTMIGAELSLVPAATVSWADARDAHPDAPVLDRPTGQTARPYGIVPYPNYETAAPSAGHVAGEIDDRLPPKRRVVGLNIGGERVAVDRLSVTAAQVVPIEVGGRQLIVFWAAGTSSALDGRAIEDGVDVGAVGVFSAELDGRELTFEVSASSMIADRETGSAWNVSGQAVSGPLAGQALEPVVHLDTFWFAWSRYHPDTDVLG